MAETPALPEKLHAAVMAWQQRHFADYPFLLEHWTTHYRQAPFQLVAKLGELKQPSIETGRQRGRLKYDRAREMDEETFEQVRKIIRAQASTELGSIQQHRETLLKAQDSRLQFDILRVMAEEFRHGYQMIYLLAQDDWGGGSDAALQAIDELLEMKTGSHVLDAFNVFFDSFVDNVVFAAVIDRVGKYQLQMQQIFAYAPMARSMGPMLSEEAFHLATGMGGLRQWVAEAARDEGNVSIRTVQQHLNKWVPRGLEMFGDERGGTRNVDLGLKTMANREAAARYHQEVGEQVVDVLNAAIVRARAPELSPEETAAVISKIRAGEFHHGLHREDLLRLPHAHFFRRRGTAAFERIGVDGAGFRTTAEFLRHLRQELPPAYLASPDFGSYVESLKKAVSGQPVSEESLPFFG